MSNKTPPCHRLRMLRIENDYTQENIAKLINVTQSTYSKYERGEDSVPYATLIKLADHYHVSLDYLFERTDCPEIIDITTP